MMSVLLKESKHEKIVELDLDIRVKPRGILLVIWLELESIKVKLGWHHRNQERQQCRITREMFWLIH